MSKSATIAASAAAAAFVWDSVANATIVNTTFNYSGQTNVEGNINNFGPGFPPGGVFRSDDGSEGSTSFGTITGSGADSPVFTFSNGATAAGDTTANSTTTVTVEITNDEAFAQQITWNFLIFAGGLGIVEPDFDASTSCNAFQIDLCDVYSAPSGSHGASASLEFGVALDGTSIFSGNLFVDDAGNTINFDGISLMNFGATPGNSQYFRWEDTTFSQDLGIFAPGETKTLTFFTSVAVAATLSDGCFFDIDLGTRCPAVAQAGYGDPDGMNGGIITRSFSLLTPMSGTIQSDPAAVPVPGAVWLFLTGLGGVFGARRLKKKSA